jgi:hypothetical protein
VKQVLREQIATLAQAGKPDIRALIGDGGAVGFPSARAIGQQPFIQLLPNDSSRSAALIAAAAAAQSRMPDGVSFACWLHGEAIVKRLEADIDATADDSKALSAEQRASELERLKAALLTAERMEVFICELDKEPLRSDIDVRAVLVISGPPPEGAP